MGWIGVEPSATSPHAKAVSLWFFIKRVWVTSIGGEGMKPWLHGLVHFPTQRSHGTPSTGMPYTVRCGGSKRVL